MTCPRAIRALLLALLAGCGRTPLDEVPVPSTTVMKKDASATVPGTGGVISGSGGDSGTGGAFLPDAAVDRVPIDVVPDVPSRPIQVSCPRSMTVRTRRPVHLEAMVTGGAGWLGVWMVTEAPRGSAVARAQDSGTTFDFTPDLVGTYRLRFQAVDQRGAGQACETTVSAQALPPVVFCPPATTATVGREIMLTGDAKDDAGPVALRWSVSPLTASLMPPEGATTRFLARSAGTYLVTLTGTDIDGASAACTTTVHVDAAPMAFCPPSGQKLVRLHEATFEVKVDSARLATTRWSLTKRPAGSMAEPSTPSGLSTDLTPDVLGDYLLEFVGRTPDGTEARCQTTFTAVSEAPALECTDIDTRPLVDTDVMAAVSDNGEIRRWQWTLDAQPPGSAVKPMFPMGDSFTFKPDLAGDYRFTLQVTDDEGLSARCSFDVHAVAEEGLRIEMFWDSNATDMDLHLLSPVAKRWYDEVTNQDCFYSNCTGVPPSWSNPASEVDDPHLDLDDTDGFGPENINVDRPAAGVYRVGVHAYSGFARQVTVRLYCGGSRLEPRATLGPISLAMDQVWKVADVAITSDGRCEVKSLAGPGGAPTVVDRTEAEMSR